MKPFLMALWEKWKLLAHWIGGRQATLIYTVLYFSLVGPIALVRQFFSDPFQYQKRNNKTFWVPRPQAPANLEEARRQ